MDARARGRGTLFAALLAGALVAGASCGGGSGDGGVAPADGAADAAQQTDGAADAAQPADGAGPGADAGAGDAGAAPDVLRPVCAAPPGGFGCPCGSNGDCDSGYCVPWDEGFVCSETCLTTCPAGWDCRGLPQLAPDVVFVCWPGGSRLCQPCAGDDACGEGVCAALGDGTRCVRPCGPERPCPDGYVCAPTPSAFPADDAAPDGDQCVPASGACDCGPWLEEERRLRPCRHESADGTCWGEQTCDPAAGWSECTAARPAPETCNGADDDCDGTVDDLPGRGEPCTTDNALGSCPGVRDCADGPALGCVGPVPAAERCNGADDDCDGTTDEGFADLLAVCRVGRGACERTGVVRCTADGRDADCDVVAGPSAAETCNGQDDDCDGVTDEDLAAPACALSAGVCAGATQTCGGALGWQPCDGGRYGADYESMEGACDGRDNDCDGATDEVDADGDGARAEDCGGTDCDDANPLAHPGAAEVCGDGVDNDCDGAAENRDADGDGVVAAACGGPDCNDASDQARPGLEEVCGDGLDNDCDGSIDDRDADGDRFLDPACGGFDCDDTAEGVHPAAAEACNGVDDDCDGVTDQKDADGDGFVDAHPLCGGTDCDDGRREVHPGALEVCGDAFDLDEDCSGAVDDLDRDGDGAVADDPACGGDDCDDGDDRAFAGATEVYDLVDDDCDGAVDEGLVPVGVVIVSEVLNAPDAVADAAGEWIEVYNAWHLPVNLAGWTVAVGAGAPQAIEGAADGALVLPPQSAAVLCRDPDPATNGGVACTGRFTGALLADDADAVALGHGGVTIDRVAWTGAAPFPRPVGRALVLDPHAFSAAANDRGGNWCAARDADLLPGGDRGTPGAVNPPCSGAPRVDAVTPGDGMDVGGFPIVIAGAGFTGATDVRLGGSPCVAWEVWSDAELRCTTAPHLAGDVDVTVVKGAAAGTLPAGYRYTGEYTPLITWASAGRRPDQPVVATAGQESPDLYGEVRWAGVTGDAGTHSGVSAQAGWGPHGTHPRYDPRWVWVPASFERPYFENDEYVARVVVPTAGTYSYVFRFSEDGGLNWEYGDREPGAADGFELTDLGTLDVR